MVATCPVGQLACWPVGLFSERVRLLPTTFLSLFLLCQQCHTSCEKLHKRKSENHNSFRRRSWVQHHGGVKHKVSVEHSRSKCLCALQFNAGCVIASAWHVLWQLSSDSILLLKMVHCCETDRHYCTDCCETDSLYCIDGCETVIIALIAVRQSLLHWLLWDSLLLGWTCRMTYGW